MRRNKKSTDSKNSEFLNAYNILAPENLSWDVAIYKIVQLNGDQSKNENRGKIKGIMYNGSLYSGHELSKILRLTDSPIWRITDVNQTDSTYSQIQVSSCLPIYRDQTRPSSNWLAITSCIRAKSVIGSTNCLNKVAASFPLS